MSRSFTTTSLLEIHPQLKLVNKFGNLNSNLNLNNNLNSITLNLTTDDK